MNYGEGCAIYGHWSIQESSEEVAGELCVGKFILFIMRFTGEINHYNCVRLKFRLQSLY